MLTLSQKQIESVLKLPGPQRYSHFIKRVVDSDEAWGLWTEDGWALSSTDKGETAFPLWPHRQYAALCAVDAWEGYEPAAIPLDDLLTELLPKLRADRVCVSVFRSPEGEAVFPAIEQLTVDLRQELTRYE